MLCHLCEDGTNCPVHDPVDMSMVNMLEPCQSASGGIWWPSWNTETKVRKKMAKNKAASFKVSVKDGDTQYKLNKTGQYESKVIDYVVEHDNLGDALLAFLEYATDPYNEDKVTLSLTPAKKGNK